MTDKIIYTGPKTIKFNGMNGRLMSPDDEDFIPKRHFLENYVNNFNLNDYSRIFYFNDLAGAYLLVKSGEIRYIKCGSGIPILEDRTIITSRCDYILPHFL